MPDTTTVTGPDSAAHTAPQIVQIEVTLPGEPEPQVLQVPAAGDILAAVRQALGLAATIELFEVDGDAPLATAPPGRKALRLVAHEAHQIKVTVNFEHRSESQDFPPSKTVFKVLQWAVGKKGFDLDPQSAARANLILPGADQPLPREAPIGSFVPPGQHVLVVDLTLKDFTNG